MSKLSAFLHPTQAEEIKDIIISKRFVGEDGKPAPFKIKTITGEENESLRASCTRRRREKGMAYDDFNAEQYSKKIILACVAEPDFSAEELCKAYGTMDPLEVPGRMLLAGELNALSRAIAELNGFGEDPGDEAKNS